MFELELVTKNASVILIPPGTVRMVVELVKLAECLVSLVGSPIKKMFSPAAFPYVVLIKVAEVIGIDKIFDVMIK